MPSRSGLEEDGGETWKGLLRRAMRVLLREGFLCRTSETMLSEPRMGTREENEERFHCAQNAQWRRDLSAGAGHFAGAKWEEKVGPLRSK